MPENFPEHVDARIDLDLGLTDDDPVAIDEGPDRIGYGAYARYSPAILGLLIVAVVALIGWREWQPEDDLPRLGQLIDQPAPGFTLALFSGESVSLDDYAGQALALNFWASWCDPCRREMPAIDQVVTEMRAEGWPVAALGVGIKSDYDKSARELLDELAITYPAGRDTAGEDVRRGPIEAAYGTFPYPSTVFIRPDGTVFAIRIGEIDAGEIRAYFEGALE